MNPPQPHHVDGNTVVHAPTTASDRGVRGLLLDLLAVPLGVLMLVPLAGLFAAWFFFAACKEGVLGVLHTVVRRTDAARGTMVLPPPHFNDARRPISDQP